MGFDGGDSEGEAVGDHAVAMPHWASFDIPCLGRVATLNEIAASP